MSTPINTTDIRNASSSFAGYEAPDIFEQMQKRKHETARQARLERLSSMYLYDKEGFDRTEIDADPVDSMTMGARHNADDFHMLMGDEIAHSMGGNVYDTAEYLISTLPDEEQGKFKQDLEHSLSVSDGRRVVSRIMERHAFKAYDDAQAQRAEQQKVIAQHQRVLEQTIEQSFDNENDIIMHTNEARAALKLAKIESDSLQRAVSAYAYMRNKAQTDENVAMAAMYLGDDEVARGLLLERMRQDGAKNPIDSWVGSAVESVVDVGVGFLANLPLPSSSQPRYEYGSAEEEDYKSYIDTGAALKHDMKEAYEKGRTEDASTGASLAYNLTNAFAKATQSATPVGLLSLFREGVQNAHGRAASSARFNPEISSDEIRTSATFYGGVEAAAWKGTSMAFFGQAYKALPILQKAAAKMGATRVGAFASATAFAAADDVIMTMSEFGIKGLYDYATNAPDELKFAGEEFNEWLEGWSDPETQTMMGLFYALGGLSSTPELREAHAAMKVSKKEALKMGLTEADYDDALKLDEDERTPAMARKMRQHMEEDFSAWSQRVIAQAKLSKDRELHQKRRADAALHAAMRVQGISEGQSDKEGMVRVYYDGVARPDGTFDQGETYLDLTREDADDFIGGGIYQQQKEIVHKIRDLGAKNALQGAFTDILSGDVQVEKMLGSETPRSLQHRANLAREKMELLMSEGMSEREAKRTIAPEISQTQTLESLMITPEHFAQRIELERQRGGDADSPISQAYVVTQFVGDQGRKQRILRMSHDMNLAQGLEEIAEQSLLDRIEDEDVSMIDLYRELDDIRSWMAQDKQLKVAADKFLGLSPDIEQKLEKGDALSDSEREAVTRAVIEGTSRLMTTNLMSRALDGNVPEWMAEPIAALTPHLMELPEDLALARTLSAAREAGVLDNVASRLMNATMDDIEAAISSRSAPDADALMSLYHDSLLDQAHLDAANGSGVMISPLVTSRVEQVQREAAEEYEQQMAEENEAADAIGREYIAEQEAEGASHADAVKANAEKAADAQTEKISDKPDAQQDAAFDGGVYIPITDERGQVVKSGVLGVDDLEIMPNFKLGSDAEGVVHPLKGDYRPDHDPIRVWRRADGSLMVISGRHRLDAAKRAGASRITAYLYEESPEFDQSWARRYDVESNIRDNQASPLEVALYVRGEFTDGRTLTEEEISRSGIAREGKLGHDGYLIGRNAGESVMEALRNGRIDTSDALHLARAVPHADDVQSKGLAALLDGASRAQAIERMVAEVALKKLQQDVGVDGGLDLFGNRLDDEEFMRFVAEYVTKKKNTLGKDISYLRTTAGRKQSAAMATRYGVDLKDPDGMKKALSEAQALKERWAHPYTDPELMGQVRLAWLEKTPTTNFSLSASNPTVYRISANEKVESKKELVDILKGKRGTFINKKSGVVANLSRDGAGKLGHAAGESVTNLVRLGYTEEEATTIHYTAASRVTDLYEKAQLYLREEAYHKKQEREAVFHFFEPVIIETSRGEEAFLANISVIEFVNQNDGKRVFSLEMTIENPISVSETVTPYTGARKQKSDEVSGLRLSAFNSFVKKEKKSIEHQARAQGLIPWVEDVQAIEELTRELDHVKDEIARTSDRHVKHKQRLHEKLEAVQGHLNAERMPKDHQNPSSAIAPNGEPSKLSLDQWLNVRTQSFKEWFGDWESDPENASKALDENGEPRLFYHGTRSDTFTVFNPRDHVDENFRRPTDNIWVTVEKDIASTYARGGEVMELFLNTRRVKTINAKGQQHYNLQRYSYKGTNDIASWVKSKGYDAVQIKNIKDTPSFYDLPPSEVWAIFSPYQLKSATNNRGTYSNETPNINFSLGGLRAKSAGAAVQRGTTFIDPADGQTKFFIDPTESRLNTGFKMGQITSIPAGGHKDVSLAALLDFPEVYQAYPELRDLRVRLYKPKAEDHVYGYFSPPSGKKAAYIGINANHVSAENAQRFKQTLMHEMQHAIQRIEGFSRGAGSMNQNGAALYLRTAIKQRKDKGISDDWSRDNLAFMEELLEQVNQGDDAAIDSVYTLSSGEQEARRVQEGKPIEEHAAYISSPSHYTISIAQNATELGGITFDKLGRFGRILHNRLRPVGDFTHDRLIYQMIESVQRRVREAESHGDDNSGLQLAHEALSILTSFERYLPASYGFALEPYKQWIHTFANLHGSADPQAAGNVLRMKGWNKIMRMSFMKQLGEILTGKLRSQDAEFWMSNESTRALLDEVQQHYIKTLGDADTKRGREAALEQTLAYVETSGLDEKIFKAMGEVKVERVLAKFLDRVSQQLDAYRKDVHLGKIRRVVSSLTPLPSKDGKPVKGRMPAENYKKVMDYMRLLEMTKGEKITFDETRYTGENQKEKAWDDMTPDENITVDLFDAEGKKETLTLTKQEFETYASFDTMSAEQAETVSRMLGEYITTGKNAWENIQEQKLEHIRENCTPALQKVGAATDDEVQKLQNSIMRKVMPVVRKIGSLLGWAMNDVQTLDSISSEESLRSMATQWRDRAVDGHLYAAQSEKRTQLFTMKTIMAGAGIKNKKEFSDYMQEVNTIRDTGIVLIEQAPDFRDKAHEEVKRQMVDIFDRKSHRKRDRQDPLISSLVAIEEAGAIPELLLDDLGRKQNTYIKQALLSINKGEDVPASVKKKLKAKADENLLAKALLEKIDKKQVSKGTIHRLQQSSRDHLLAAALQAVKNGGNTPTAIIRELEAKYGGIGDPTQSPYRGDDALKVFFTEKEYERYTDANANIKAKESKLLEDWQKEKKEKQALTDRYKTGERKEGKSMNITRAQAAYRVLMCEQEDLIDSLRQQGYTPDVVRQLEEYAGADLMRIARKLRVELNARKAELKRIYESVYGMPFPEVKNYFRAFFNVSYETKEKTVIDGQGTGNAAGTGKVKVLYTRRKHNARIDQTMSLFSAFSAGMKEQDILIGFEDLPQEMARTMNFSEGEGQDKHDMKFALTKLLGTQTVANLDHIAKNYSQLAPEVETSTQAATKLQNALSSTSARIILSSRVGTLFKQGTAYFNSLHGVDHISTRAWMTSAARVTSRRGKSGWREMLERPELAARFKGWGQTEISQAIRLLADVKISNQNLEALGTIPLEAIEAIDVKANALSSAIMYDASYRYHQQQGEMNGEKYTPEQLDEMAMYDVRTALAVKSQPQSWLNRSLTSSQQSAFKVFSFFLGGESINTFGNFVRLLSKKQYKKAGVMWFTHGIALQALTLAYNLITDDEELREKRSAWGYISGALLGPISGIPLVGPFVPWLVNGISPKIEDLAELIGLDVDLPHVYGSSLIPMGDIDRLNSRANKAFSDKGTWDDKVIVVNDALRILATLTALGTRNSTSKTGAMINAGAYATASVGNILDFFVKTGKNVSELVD